MSKTIAFFASACVWVACLLSIALFVKAWTMYGPWPTFKTTSVVNVGMDFILLLCAVAFCGAAFFLVPVLSVVLVRVVEKKKFGKLLSVALIGYCVLFVLSWSPVGIWFIFED